MSRRPCHESRTSQQIHVATAMFYLTTERYRMFLMRHYLLVLNYTYTQPENWLKNNTFLLSRVDYCVRIDSDRCIALPLPNAIVLIIFIFV